jgi:predicted amidohydrolase YtcJ
VEVTTRPLLLRDGLVLTPGGTVRADVLLLDGRVAAVTPTPPPGAARPVTGGGSTGQEGRLGGVGEVALEGRLVTPAFVDAHVHLAATGLAAHGADLSTAGSVEEALERLAAHPQGDDDAVLLGHGWDETRWPGGRPPTRSELDRAVGDRPAYVSRVDVHSAVVSTALLRILDARNGLPRTADLTALAGWSDDGPLTREAHHAVRGAYHALVPPSQRCAAIGRALREAARLGVGTVHELGAPHLSDRGDALLAEQEREAARSAGSALPRVVAYWAEHGDLALNRERGWGSAGDICVDGAVGSRTAALSAPYADADTEGHLYLTAEEVADHVLACTEAGLQAGFHVIGDRAVATAVTGLQQAAATVGPDVLRAARHRLEHVEMVTPEQVGVLAGLGVTASVQPLFDGWWGGSGGLYEQRLGDRHRGMNPFATMAAAGVALAFGSDSPVTPVAPWRAVRAAVHHSDPEQRVPAATALEAATAGGWSAARRDGGTLEVGAPADVAVWDVTALDPALDPAAAVPRCLLTVVGGRVAHGDPDDLRPGGASRD